MCAELMEPENFSTEELQQAIDRKMKKFGSLLSTPVETRKLVEAGLAELDRRGLRI